jgi:alanine dehydrogenase
MPLLLTRSDLRPLAASDEALDGAIDAVEASILSSHAGEAGESIFAGLALSNGDELAANCVASAQGPACLRIFPHRFTGTRENAWLGIQVDGSSGEIDSFIALDDLNPLRTSVPAAVGVRHLAPAGASTLAILGSGTQARSHARTFRRVMPNLKSIQVWSPTPEHRERFAADLAERTGMYVSACGTAEAAVDQADVITAAGRLTGGEPAVSNPASVRPGALFVSMTASGLNLLGLGARMAVPTFKRPELIAHGFSSGFLRQAPPPPPPHALQIADVILGNAPARSSQTETLVYELAGPYLWDIPILSWIRQWADARGIGSHVNFSD